jgi:hypothetical protein
VEGQAEAVSYDDHITKRIAEEKAQGARDRELESLRRFLEMGRPTPEEEEEFLEVCRPVLRESLRHHRRLDEALRSPARWSGDGLPVDLFRAVGESLFFSPLFGQYIAPLSALAREPILYGAYPGYDPHKHDLDDVSLNEDLDQRADSDAARRQLELFFRAITTRAGVKRKTTPRAHWVRRWVEARAEPRRSLVEVRREIVQEASKKLDVTEATFRTYLQPSRRGGGKGRPGRPKKRIQGNPG